ncbi:MAG: DNA-processing protein DprA [Candidatus Pacebacteria bacterium]|nr:DNA-processing protein DprA [Candidatus Paceibacterota bacterium]
MNETEKIFANAFNQSPQLDAVSLKKIKKSFGSFEKAWKAEFSKIKTAGETESLKDFREGVNPEKEFEFLEKEDVKILLEDEFPSSLKETFPEPQMLYLKGNLPGEKQILLAVVGTRKFSSYGQQATEKIIHGFNGFDINIVSGLALGIDAIAHKAAMENGLKTTAVLGCGLSDSVIYPRANFGLAKEILEKGGSLVSEYPLKMRAAKYTFPRRNRIVAGLSKGILVTDAPEKSGAMITAYIALEYGKEVMAVPGSIFSENSKGPNLLIKMGAVPVTEAKDAIFALGLEEKSEEKNGGLNLSSDEEKIIFLLSEPKARDEIIKESDLTAKEVMAILMQMEIKGLIKENGGKIYKK